MPKTLTETPTLPPTQIIRSHRKTIALKICQDGTLEVRIPWFTRQSTVQKIISKHQNWILKTREKIQKTAPLPPLKEEEIQALIQKTKKYILPRTEEFSKRFKLSYKNIRINRAQSRWGSCSIKKDLNFSCRLGLLPTECIDYVIIHELAHLKIMNHSKSFWTLVAEMMPDYKVREKQLKALSKTLPRLKK